MAFKKSHVELNEYFINRDRWNAKAILRRGQGLSEQIARIWARPDSKEHPWHPSDGDVDVITGGTDETEVGDWSYTEFWNAFLPVLAATDGSLWPKAVYDRPPPFRQQNRGVWLFHIC